MEFQYFFYNYIEIVTICGWILKVYLYVGGHMVDIWWILDGYWVDFAKYWMDIGWIFGGYSGIYPRASTPILDIFDWRREFS